jgi:hypothetical protein
MSFGRNPHVAKAEAAELKAESAKDEAARALAWREAARQWDRAAERESDDKKRRLYESHAEAARTRADSPNADDAPSTDTDSADTAAAPPGKPTLLN